MGISVGERLGILAAAGFEAREVTGGLEVTRTSIFTQKRNTMTLPIDVERLVRWRSTNALVQDVFPELSADQREFLMSGATPEEWAGMFPPEEEEE